MILYFTGTGNSGYIAQRIAEALGDELLSMNTASRWAILHQSYPMSA